MEESKTYLEMPDCKVTGKYLILHSQKYKISDINGVFVTKLANYRRYPIFVELGFLFLAFIADSVFWCMFAIVSIVITLILMKTKYALRLKIGIGETRPVISHNQKELQLIKNAIERAMADLD